MDEVSSSERASLDSQNLNRDDSCSRSNTWIDSETRSDLYDSDYDLFEISSVNTSTQSLPNSRCLSPSEVPFTSGLRSQTFSDTTRFVTPQNQRIKTNYSENHDARIGTSTYDGQSRLQLDGAPMKKTTNNPRRFQTEDERDSAIGCVAKNLFSGL